MNKVGHHCINFAGCSSAVNFVDVVHQIAVAVDLNFVGSVDSADLDLGFVAVVVAVDPTVVVAVAADCHFVADAVGFVDSDAGYVVDLTW